MIIKSLKYMVLTPSKPKVYLNMILKEEKKRSISDFLILFSLGLSVIFSFNQYTNLSTSEILIYISGFIFGYLFSVFVDIYLITLIISKIKKTEFDFQSSKVIVSVILLPLVLMFISMSLFPYNELAFLYKIIFITWYFLLLAASIFFIYKLRPVQSILISFNIFIFKSIIFLVFIGIKT